MLFMALTLRSSPLKSILHNNSMFDEEIFCIFSQLGFSKAKKNVKTSMLEVKTNESVVWLAVDQLQAFHAAMSSPLRVNTCFEYQHMDS